MLRSLSLQKSEVEFIESTLKNREKEFCACFAETGDAKLSARLSGYRLNSRAKGIKLLARDDIQTEINRLVKSKEKLARTLASVGYQRLAFGNTSDAVSLIFSKEPGEAELGSMDLFMISEIKKPKDGSIEIKFFDRLKALEKLEQISSDSPFANFFDAIGESGSGSERGD